MFCQKRNEKSEKFSRSIWLLGLFYTSCYLLKMSVISGLQNHVELEFRACRIGTLRTFPVERESAEPNKNMKPTVPALISESGVEFVVHLQQDDVAEDITIKIPAKNIISVETYMQRSCPVVWITPNKACAKKIRTQCGIKDRNGPYVDPASEVEVERQIALIPCQDPLPFAISHNMKTIFQNMGKTLKKDKFFQEISHKMNNDKLVQCTMYMDKVVNSAAIGRGQQNQAGAKNSQTMSLPVVQDQTQFTIRTCRLGTLKTFPLNPKSNRTLQPGSDLVTLNEHGIKLYLQLEQDGSADGLEVVIPSDNIQSVEAYMMRGCPVLWITPKKSIAKKIRKLFGMTDKDGPNLDPESESSAEQQIAMITQDPLPFAVSHSIKTILHKVAVSRGIDKAVFLKDITHKQNNEKLVQNTIYMDAMEERAKEKGKPKSSSPTKSKKTEATGDQRPHPYRVQKARRGRSRGGK